MTIHQHVNLSSNWRRTAINLIPLFWARSCSEPTSWKADFGCIFSAWRWREPMSQHLLVLIWCKYAAFQFHSILSVLLSSLSLIVQLFLKGQLLLIQLMASQRSLNWLRAPAYLEELWWRWCLTLLRCDVLSRMPSQVEELMWQLSAGRKKIIFFLKVAFLLL